VQDVKNFDSAVVGGVEDSGPGDLLIPEPGAAVNPRLPAVSLPPPAPGPAASMKPWHPEDPPSRAYGGRSPMAPNPRTLAPNTSLHRTPAAAPPSPVSSQPLGDGR
jgi:hypothetical protein